MFRFEEITRYGDGLLESSLEAVMLAGKVATLNSRVRFVVPLPAKALETDCAWYNKSVHNEALSPLFCNYLRAYEWTLKIGPQSFFLWQTNRIPNYL